jgi:hypothetical protein
MRKKQPYPIDTCQFVEHYSRRLANEGTDTVELRLEDLNNPELLLHLGRVAALSLAKFATCTFLADPDGCVRLMNPLQVFMQADQSIAPEGKVPVFVRPVLVQARPQFVGVREDGTVWEVEYRDPEDAVDEM